jgi:uncharacterized protein YhdP
VLAGPGPTDLSLAYGPVEALVELAAGASGGAPTLTRAAVGIGANPAPLPDEEGVIVRGRLEELRLGPWLAWGRDVAGRLARRGSSAAPGSILGVDVLPSRLQVDALHLGRLELTDMDLRVVPPRGVESSGPGRRDGGWSVAFDAAETSGSVALPPPDSDGSIELRLEQLDLGAVTPQDVPPPGQSAPAAGLRSEIGADPRTIDPFVLSVESLRRGGDVLGRLTVVAEPADDGVTFSDLRLDGPLLRAEGKGRWTIDATDYVETVLDLNAHSEDLGRLLQTLDYYSDVQDAPADAQLELRWSGGPERFSLTRARGTLQLSLGPGRLLAVDPGVGRVLGLVNLSALTRRLSLDFTDLTDPGFGFDAMTGRIGLANGQARIDDLELKSSAADIRLRGTADLVRKTVDQTVWVTPKMGSGVAIAGAIAGGPLVGAAVLLADKVSGGGVDRVGRQEYRVSGPWEEPTIERVALLSGNLSPAVPKASPPRNGAASPEPGRSPAAKNSPSAPAADSDNPFLEGF